MAHGGSEPDDARIRLEPPLHHAAGRVPREEEGDARAERRAEERGGDAPGMPNSAPASIVSNPAGTNATLATAKPDDEQRHAPGAERVEA